MRSRNMIVIIWEIGDPPALNCISIWWHLSENQCEKCIIWHGYNIPWHMRKNLIYYSTNSFSAMFITVLVIITGKQKQLKYPSTNKWLMKLWFICTMKIYLAVEINDIMKFLGKQVDLEEICVFWLWICNCVLITWSNHSNQES